MPSAENTDKKTILIAGGGFGGVTAALLLNKKFRKNPELKKAYRILLVNNHHSHLYTPALYEIASIPRGRHTLQYVKSAVAIPLADIFHGAAVEWEEKTIAAFDRDKKEAVFDTGERRSYEYLVLALGAKTSYMNIPGAAEYSFPLKTFADAVRLRDKVQSLIGAPARHPEHILIAGAGAAGVEVAAEFENFIRLLTAEKQRLFQITLLEGGPEILPGFEPWVAAKAKKRLRKLGVAIKTDTLITAVKTNEVVLKDGSSLPYSILVWTGGVEAAKVLQTLNLPLSPKGGVMVNDRLEAGEKIYGVGDNVCYNDPESRKPLPWNVPVAEAEASYAAEAIVRSIKGEASLPFKPAKHFPFILAVGQKYAIADLGFWRLAGLPAWILKQFIELKYMLSILPLPQAAAGWLKFMSVATSNDTEIT